MNSQDSQKVIQMSLLLGQATFLQGLLDHLSPPNKSLRYPKRITVRHVTQKVAHSTLLEPLEDNNQ